MVRAAWNRLPISGRREAMSTHTDSIYGRRGGRFLPDGYEATDFANARRCNVCGRPMVVGQKVRHFICSPIAECGCGPVDLLSPKHHHDMP